MHIIKEVVTELFSMFMGDAKLSIAIVVLIGVLAVVLHTGIFGTLVPGILLMLGCIAILAEAVIREARKRRTHS